MAYEIKQFSLTLEAAADLSSSQFKAVKLDANGKAAAIAAATDLPIGILQNKPTTGQAAEVLVDGVTKWQADAALTPGQLVGPSADGQADAKTLGTDITEHAVGVVLEGAGAAGNFATVLVRCGLPNRAV